MSQRSPAIDTEAFIRATNIFETKRQVLPPDVVQNLARDIVHRVANSSRSLRQFETITIDQESLANFCDLLVLGYSGKALEFIQARRDAGLSYQGVVFGYLAPAAQLLGERWDRDEISFMDVTAGVGLLYALMRAVQPALATPHQGFAKGRSALFAAIPGETHHIGISIAADTFRQEGWNIDSQIGATFENLVAHVEATRPAIIGLSFSTRDRLPDLVRLVVALRLIESKAVIGVAPPSAMTDEEVMGVVDVDIVFRDARQAYLGLERLMRLRD